VGEGVVEVVGECVGVVEEVKDRVGVVELVGEDVGVGKQLAGVEAPGVEQAEGQGQSWQVALEAAPVAALAVPAGQGVGVVE
jgi:hypothetical protein